MNVARAWTKAWAIMKGVELPDNLPESFVSEHESELGQNRTLSGSSHKTQMFLPLEGGENIIDITSVIL